MVSGQPGIPGVLVRSHVEVESKEGHGVARIQPPSMEETPVMDTIKIYGRVISTGVAVGRQIIVFINLLIYY